MQAETDEPEVIEGVAALDVGKAEVVCCARVPGPGGQRMQEVRTISTMTAAVLALGDWLAGLGVTRVVMEATSDYWRAPFYLLEDRFQTWLVNAHDVKHLPGRPKTEANIPASALRRARDFYADKMGLTPSDEFGDEALAYRTAGARHSTSTGPSTPVRRPTPSPSGTSRTSNRRSATSRPRASASRCTTCPGSSGRARSRRWRDCLVQGQRGQHHVHRPDGGPPLSRGSRDRATRSRDLARRDKHRHRSPS
jgi:hypothetical protein